MCEPLIAYHLDIKDNDLIDGKYHVIKKIGSGSYGDVFKVEYQNKLYALKLQHLWDVPSEARPEMVKRFQQEYKVAQKSSEYLIHSFEYGEISGNPYLTMEFCTNGDLDHYVGKDMSNIHQIAKDILEGLHVLHVDGMIHRDLKPANVLIKENGHAALTDFGSVGDMEKPSLTKNMILGIIKARPKDMKGTPLYMAPEVADRRGGGITYLPTVDIWSFGVMMYEILTNGSFPFGDIETIEELPKYQNRAKKGEIDMQKLRKSQKGSDWMPIISKCLEPDYQKRYQNVEDVLLAMKPLLGNQDSPHISYREKRSYSISRIVVTQGENMGKTYVLSSYLSGGRRMVKVGRHIDNDIVLAKNDNYLSRFHFTLERSADGTFWMIKDGQQNKIERCWVTSTNGTYINATPVPQSGIRILTGDIITVGETKIKVE